MRYLLLGGLVLIAASSFSQSEEDLRQHRIDSLKHVIANLKEDLVADTIAAREELQKLKEENEFLKSVMKAYVAQIVGETLGDTLSTQDSNRSDSVSWHSTNVFVHDPFSSKEFTTACSGPEAAGLISDSSQRVKRIRLTNVDVRSLEIKEDVTIYYKLTVTADGDVVAFSNLKSKTTTTDMTLINRIGVAIKKQVKYNKAPGSPLVYTFYTIHIKAN